MRAASGGPGRLCLAVALCLVAWVVPVVRHALAEDCTELILDGGFEVGGVWDLGATLLTPTYVTYIEHSGNQSLALGITQGGNANSYSSARQFVVIPAGADRATLAFWFYAIVEGQPSADKIQLVLLNPDGSTEYVLWTSRTDSRTWNQLTFDLTPWRGRALQVYFNVYNDGSGGTMGMFLDDVSLIACPGGATQIPPVPSAPPATAGPSKTPAPTRTPCGMVPPCATLPPPVPWAMPWESMATFEAPPYHGEMPVWEVDPSPSFLDEGVAIDETSVVMAATPAVIAGTPPAVAETPAAASWTPAGSPGVADTPIDPSPSSTRVNPQSGSGTPGLDSAGEFGFTPEVTRVSLALTAIPTPAAVRTRSLAVPSLTTTPALSGAEGPNQGRFVRWPPGWWWGVAAIVVIILGAWLWTRLPR